MAANGYYSGNIFGNDDSFLWGDASTSTPDFKWSWETDDNAQANVGTTPQGNNQNYTGNPFDPYYSSIGTENTYIPGQGMNGNHDDLTIPLINDNSIVGSQTTTGGGLFGLGDNGLPTNLNDGLNMGGGMPGTYGGSGNLGMGMPIPLPVGGLEALGLTILLNNGNVFGGGGGSIANLPGAVGNIATNPIEAVNSSLTNLGNEIMGPPGIGQAATAGAIAFPTGGNGGGNTPTNSNVVGPQSSVQGQNSNPTIAFPTGSGTNNNGTLNANTGVDNTIFGGSGGSTAVLPGGGLGTGPTGGGVTNLNNTTQSDNTIVPNRSVSVTPVEHNIPTPNPVVPTGTTHTDTTGTATTIIPGGGVPPGTVTPTTPTTGIIPPIIPTNHTTMPTSALPTPRSYFGEGNQSTQDLGALWQQIAGLYGNASGAYANTDYSNYNGIANQFGGSNGNLTGIANNQTAAANTSLRTGNLNDVQNLYGQALGIRNDANPNLYGQNGALNSYTQGAQGNLQWAQNQLNSAGNLSPEDVRNSQQAAREAWSARGLVNSPGAVGEEILNRSNLTQQRQQQAFNNVNTALGGMQGATSAQQQNIFDPFGTILGAQYGQQTNNAGSNNSLFGQASSFGSGAQGNQFVQNAFNPYNNYSQDVYSSNNNAANAQYISGQNNAAALQGANTQGNAQLLNNFLGSLAGLYGSGAFGSCWVAREVYGVNDPKWLMFRHWLLTEAPSWFRNAYLKHGEKFAAWLKRNAWLKPAIRTFMDSKINRTFIFKEDFSHAV